MGHTLRVAPRRCIHRERERPNHKHIVSQTPQATLSIPRRIEQPEKHFAVPYLLELNRIMGHTLPFAQDSQRSENPREWKRWLGAHPLPPLGEQWDTEFARIYGTARRGELSCAELRRICKARRQLLNMLLHEEVPRRNIRSFNDLFPLLRH
ncbi:MAG: hypothetical protein U0136_07275 [Bdellovibrionota bacterium]